MNAEIKKLNIKAEQYSKKLDKVLEEVKKAIVGQEEILGKLLISLIADGHVLLEGVPGLAKTLMIHSLSSTLNAKFQRIQFTPDLLPADIMGTKIYDHKSSTFSTKKGPVFANFILADEINRAPPKVQSALLEAMQERQVTIQGDTFPLQRPFLVLATQNPIETEGTYKLPEAQVDRFMFKLLISYPNREEEKEIIRRYTKGAEYKISRILSPDEIKKIQQFNTRIYADEKIEEYVSSLVDATRNPEKYGLEFGGHIDYGASPRASIWLILAAKARALLNSRGYVLPEDVKAIAYDVLRHRIILSYEAEAEELTADDIIKKAIDKVKLP
ncbi:AAA domain-containing protein [Candidatus Woesearchaeota archaeon]|nr:AAA domain-containing protein [Candidatus Woesearchaeota archaeon]